MEPTLTTLAGAALLGLFAGSSLRVRADGSVEYRPDRDWGWTVALYADLADAFARAHLGRDGGPPFERADSGRYEAGTPAYPRLRGYRVHRLEERDGVDGWGVGCVGVPLADWRAVLGAACDGGWAWRTLDGGGLAAALLGRVLLVAPPGSLSRFRWVLLSRREALQLAEHTGLR